MNSKIIFIFREKRYMLPLVTMYDEALSAYIYIYISIMNLKNMHLSNLTHKICIDINIKHKIYFTKKLLT